MTTTTTLPAAGTDTVASGTDASSWSTTARSASATRETTSGVDASEDTDGNHERRDGEGVVRGDGIRNAPALQVLALVNVTSPEEGGSVSGTFTASGVASSFEATVPWEIRSGSDLVASGFATAEGWMGKLYPWETTIPVSHLAPGDYTFIAYTDDPSGGAEGGGPTEDSKAITVR